MRVCARNVPTRIHAAATNGHWRYHVLALAFLLINIPDVSRVSSELRAAERAVLGEIASTLLNAAVASDSLQVRACARRAHVRVK
jgi:hypothetical protein